MDGTQHPTETVDDTESSSPDDNGSTPIDYIVADLKRSERVFYGATSNLVSRAKFFGTGGAGDIAIVKGTGCNDMEFVVSGIFEIDRHNFYMGPEESYLYSSIASPLQS